MGGGGERGGGEEEKEGGSEREVSLDFIHTHLLAGLVSPSDGIIAYTQVLCSQTLLA